MSNTEKNKQIASEITTMLNAFGIDYKGICEAMTHEHPTLQQNFTRLCVAWLRTCGTKDENCFDDRNIASHKLGKKLLPILDDVILPFI